MNDSINESTMHQFKYVSNIIAYIEVEDSLRSRTVCAGVEGCELVYRGLRTLFTTAELGFYSWQALGETLCDVNTI